MAGMDDIAVLTSENVRLTYTLAGLGSRFTAFLIDLVVVTLAGAGITGIFFILGLAMSDLSFSSSTSVAGSILAGIYIFVMFFLIWGYYFFFEWINWGQTPGKQIMGIRVSMADGAPAELVACAVRNVVRLIDFALGFFGLTFFFLIFTPRYQRLGDLAAGTVVVKRRQFIFDEVMSASVAADRTMAAVGYGQAPSPIQVRLTDAEVNVIAKFLERRETLPPDVRQNLAKDFAGRIRSRVADDSAAGMSDEGILQAALNQSRKRT